MDKDVDLNKGRKAADSPTPADKVDPWDGFITDEERALLEQASAQLTHEQTAQQAFRQNAKAVAEEICTLALSAPNDRVRLDAGRYVIDRVLGRVGDAKELEKSGAPWEKVYDAVIREPSATDRGQGASVGL